MSDFTLATQHAESTNVYTDVAWYPRVCFNPAQQWRGATILVEKGKAEFRKFVLQCVQLPGEEADRKELAEVIAEHVEFWRGMTEDFPDDPAVYEGQDGVIDAWAHTGVIPPLREAVAELSMPGLTAECIAQAERDFPKWAEQSAEREELASYRVERWLSGTRPFREKEWLPRAAMWDGFCAWCKFDGGGHDPGKPQDFYAALQELGCQPLKKSGNRGFCPPRG